MKTYTIYKLIEDDNIKTSYATETVRWVGITSLSLKERLRQHMIDKSNKQKQNWIQELKKQGKKPIIKTIVKMQFGDFHSFDRFVHEKHYIRKYKITIFNKDLNPLVSKPNKNKGKKFKHFHTANSRTKTLCNNKKV